MVLRLLGYVLSHRLDVAVANRKRTVPVLPVEVEQLGALRLEPLGRLALQLADEFGNGERSRQPAQDVNMVVNPADAEGRAFEVPARAAKIVVQFGPQVRVLEVLATAFRREDDMQVDPGKRLGHRATSAGWRVIVTLRGTKTFRGRRLPGVR